MLARLYDTNRFKHQSMDGTHIRIIYNNKTPNKLFLLLVISVFRLEFPHVLVWLSLAIEGNVHKNFLDIAGWLIGQTLQISKPKDNMNSKRLKPKTDR